MLVFCFSSAKTWLVVVSSGSGIGELSGSGSGVVSGMITESSESDKGLLSGSDAGFGSMCDWELIGEFSGMGFVVVPVINISGLS